MTTKLGTLTVDFLAKTGAFETDVKRARQTLDREGNAMEDRAGSLKDTLVAVGPAIAAAFVAAAGAVTLGVNSAINRSDELSKAASKIGFSIESLSGLSFAAELADVSLQQLQGGITRLIRAQESAASGQGEIAAVFNALGISATSANGQLRATEEVLLELADVFQALPDGPEKSALAIQLFGRSGAQLIPLLNAGSDGIRDLTDEAERLGLVLDAETGRAAEEFNDNITRLRSAWDGLTTSLATGALPTLIKITEALRDVAAAAATTFQREGLIADDFFGQDSGLIAQLFRDRGFESPTIIPDGQGPSIADVVVGGARAAPAIQFITPDTIAAGTAAGPGAGGRDGEAIAESLRKLREERERGAQAARTASEAERAFAQAQRDAAQAAAEAQRAAEERQAAEADFNALVADYRAELSGPLAQAELEWDRRKQQLQQLAERGQITQQQLNEALAITTQLRERDVEAIEAQISPAQQVLADLEEELRLLQLSNIEREIANAQRFAGVDAYSAEGQAIAEGIRAIDEARERIQFADDLRRGFEDTFASIIDGTKSAKDAFADLGAYITSLIAQRLGAQLVDSFLGPPGSPLGGGAGNIFTNFLGSLFGGGRAAGGWVAPGKMYEVAENGPELLRVGNRQFLLPTATGGMVTPNARMGGGGGVVQNITVQGRVDSRTAAQLATESARAQARARARFGA